MNQEQRLSAIRERLEAEFKPELLKIVDESHKHAGHKSAGGMGHFQITIKADSLESLSLIERHKAIYRVLDDLMQTEIHALSIKA